MSVGHSGGMTLVERDDGKYEVGATSRWDAAANRWREHHGIPLCHVYDNRAKAHEHLFDSQEGLARRRKEQRYYRELAEKGERLRDERQGKAGVLR